MTLLSIQKSNPSMVIDPLGCTSKVLENVRYLSVVWA